DLMVDHDGGLELVLGHQCDLVGGVIEAKPTVGAARYATPVPVPWRRHDLPPLSGVTAIAPPGSRSARLEISRAQGDPWIVRENVARGQSVPGRRRESPPGS